MAKVMEQLALNQTDRQFKFDIAAQPGAQHFKRCFSCGTCTASCPVSDIDNAFNPRLIIRQALLGQREELLSSKELWYCAQCYTCYARCPQDVRFTDILAVLRRMAVDEGFAPEKLLESMTCIDTLAQTLRHELADIAIEMSSNALTTDSRAAHMDSITNEIESCLSGIENDE